MAAPVEFIYTLVEPAEVGAATLPAKEIREEERVSLTTVRLAACESAGSKMDTVMRTVPEAIIPNVLNRVMSLLNMSSLDLCVKQNCPFDYDGEDKCC